MSKPKKPKDFLKTPQYKGGHKAMGEFISKNLKYPDEALTNKVEGTVEVAFTIDGLGRVVEAQVKEGIGHGCDEEALRVVKTLVFEKAINRGLRTTTKKNVKINFHLPKAQPAHRAESIQYNYTIVPSKAKPTSVPPLPKKPETYQISISHFTKSDH